MFFSWNKNKTPKSGSITTIFDYRKKKKSMTNQNTAFPSDNQQLYLHHIFKEKNNIFCEIRITATKLFHRRTLAAMCGLYSYLTTVKVAVIKSTLHWRSSSSPALFQQRNCQHLHLWHCSHSCAQQGEERALWLPHTEAHMFIHTHTNGVSSKCRWWRVVKGWG